MGKKTYIREKNSAQAWCSHNRLSQLAGQYLDDLRRHRYSEKTVYSYETALRRLLYFLDGEGIGGVADIRSGDLEKFRERGLAEGLAPGTVGMLVRVVRCFFGYLESAGIIFDNPAGGLKAPKTEKVMGHVPSEEDMVKLLAQPDTATVTGIRDRAILELAYSTGIRLEELTGLTLSGVDLANRTLRVFGKGSRERTVPLTKQACRWLKRYLSGPRGELLRYNPDEDALWIGKHKKAMSHGALGVRIGEYSKQAGVRRISPHAVRRACATHMLRNGAHPVQVQMLLGHSDLRTLSRYINVSLEDMKKTHGRSRAGK